MSATSTMTLPLSLQPIFTAPRAAATALISSRSSSNCSNTVPARFLGPAASIAPELPRCGAVEYDRMPWTRGVKVTARWSWTLPASTSSHARSLFATSTLRWNAAPASGLKWARRIPSQVFSEGANSDGKMTS